MASLWEDIFGVKASAVTTVNELRVWMRAPVSAKNMVEIFMLTWPTVDEIDAIIELLQVARRLSSPKVVAPPPSESTP